MKILYLGSFRFPDGDAAAQRVLNNARIMRDLGHKVTVLSFGGKPKKEHRRRDGGYICDGIEYVNTGDIDTHSWEERFYRFIKPAPNARALLEACIDDYDVVIGYNTLVLTGYLLGLCKRHNKRFVLDLTEWPAANEYPGGWLSPFYWQSEWAMRVTQKRVKNMIPITDFLAKYYNNAHSIVVPPLVDLNDKKWKVRQRVEKTDDLRLIYAGTPAKKDLLGNIILAVEQCLKDRVKVKLTVLGVTEHQADRLTKGKVNLERYGEAFRFMGRIPQDEVPRYYAESDFSLMIRRPSRKNMAGFPTKVVESLAAGVPVIFNPTSDLTAYLLDGENAFSTADFSVEALVHAIYMADQQTDLDKMKLKAKDSSMHQFHYSNFISLFDEFLTKLV